MRLWGRIGAAVFIMAAIGGCSFSRSSDSANVKIVIPPKTQNVFPGFTTLSAPASIDGFNCFALNVVGPGMPLAHNAPVSVDDFIRDVKLGKSFQGCAPIGLISPAADANNPQGSVLELTVPAGPSRFFQVIGILSNIGCPSDRSFLKVHDELESTYGKTYLEANLIPGMYEVGHTIEDVFRNKTVNVNSSYSSTYSDLRHCGTGTNPMNEDIPPADMKYGYAAFDSTFPDTSNNYNAGSMTGPSSLPFTYYENFTPPGRTAAIEIRFDLAGRNLTNYSQMYIKVEGAGGLATSTNCTNSNDTIDVAGGGVSVGVWLGGLNRYTGANQSSTSEIATGTFLTHSYPWATDSPLSVFDTGGSVYVSVRSHTVTNGSGNCSKVVVKSAILTLVH